MIYTSSFDGVYRIVMISTFYLKKKKKKENLFKRQDIDLRGS